MTMTVRYAVERLGKSIFLAGPTPRSPDVASWRPGALEILRGLGFDGTVFVPESSDWSAKNGYDEQVNWEWEGLNQCTVAAFWVPRELVSMPALTTNVEFGMVASSGKAILGYPEDAPKMRYLDSLAKRHCVPVTHSLESLLRMAVEQTNAQFGARIFIG